MKKVFMAVAIVLLFSIGVSAQVVTKGITGKGFKLGFDIAKINTDYNELDEFLDSRDGFIGGAYLTYALSPRFAVQPEILYASKGAEKGVFIFTAQWAIDYLEIPVLLKFDIMPKGPAHPNLFVGPALDILLSSKLKALDYEYDVTDGMKTMDFGLVFGGGIDYKHFTFDARYTMGLINIVDAAKVNAITEAEPDDFYYLEGNPTIKNTNLSFMIGVRF